MGHTGWPGPAGVGSLRGQWPGPRLPLPSAGGGRGFPGACRPPQGPSAPQGKAAAAPARWGGGLRGPEAVPGAPGARTVRPQWQEGVPGGSRCSLGSVRGRTLRRGPAAVSRQPQHGRPARHGAGPTCRVSLSEPTDFLQSPRVWSNMHLAPWESALAFSGFGVPPPTPPAVEKPNLKRDRCVGCMTIISGGAADESQAPPSRTWPWQVWAGVPTWRGGTVLPNHGTYKSEFSRRIEAGCLHQVPEPCSTVTSPRSRRPPRGFARRPRPLKARRWDPIRRPAWDFCWSHSTCLT